MTNGYPIDVTPHGSVLRGPDVNCDGFHYEARVRVQTHIHDDHMEDFDSSKGFQDILMSDATYGLLVAERNADLPFRENLFPLPMGAPFVVDQSQVVLIPSGHMLGAVQVLVRLDDGVTLGYSGDFGWPLEEVIKVDALVVDSTYGRPESSRLYSQEDAEQCLLDLVRERRRHGPLQIKAHRGTLQ